MSDVPTARDPFLELGDAARQEAAAAARAERRARLERASEIATWRGTLRDLAERQLPVSLRVRGTRTRRGRLVALGADHLGVRTPAGQLVLVRLDAVRTVRPEPGLAAPVATGDRDRIDGRRIVEVLATQFEERRRVALGCDGWEEPLVGELAALGEDVLTMQLDGAQRDVIYLPLAAVVEVVLNG